MSNERNLNIEYFKKMYLIRYFEEKIDWMFSRDMLPGTAHLCIGQEATAIGAISCIEKDDYVVSTHRGHGHLLAKGADPEKLMCEIMGKKPGYCKGIGGSQHLCALDIFFLGTNGITGGGIPFATGVGLSLKLRKSNRVVICFFGDGATNQGTFHESLNMASIWKVPVIYVCENNLYAMSTPQREAMNIEDISIRASGYGIPGISADGMDVFKVKNAVGEAVDYARQGKGPSLVELKTYRYCGHSKSDPRKYRSRKEEDTWKEKDPVVNMEKAIIDSGILPSQLEKIKKDIIKQIDDSSEFALRAPYLSKDELCPEGI